MCVFRIYIYVYMYVYVQTHMCMWYPFGYISVMGVEGSTWGVSGLCAQIHRKRYGMCWNWFTLSWDSQWCISLPSSVFSDVRWVA